MVQSFGFGMAEARRVRGGFPADTAAMTCTVVRWMRAVTWPGRQAAWSWRQGLQGAGQMALDMRPRST
jgi:hypothetical protein